MDCTYKRCCTGCGLCESLGLTKMTADEKGFLYPESVSEEMESLCEKVCPVGPHGIENKARNNTWGNYIRFWAGFSSDDFIRNKASSGGILTSICCWLIQNKIVDAIIQTTYDESNVTNTKTVLSPSIDSVIHCSGSRYSKSSPLIDIKQIILDGRKYAFVGKPCDVIALRNYMEIEPKVKESILYTFSFFCAGTPSQCANNRLLKELGVTPDVCSKLSYRGNGWPGYTTAYDSNGNSFRMDYQKAWMDILGRDIRYSCKFCFDSIGEQSDVSCGDFWYLNDRGEPDFSEHKGRNCIFAWSENGRKLVERVQKDGALILENADLNALNKAQPNHFNRRSTLFTKLVIMKAAKRKVPKYPISVLLRHMQFNSLLAQCRAGKGTLERIIKGKI